ncbi:MAG: 2-oxoacid:acceptor oxidoreductase family protein [Spirochaetales bacterium]|uniref:2-oxoacid:acceptor oxidoreductase family protein n=1 Tax=Candidatus Thalassospirochaeta sargassi TaxID=3119039 RepID=A0AAJ1IH01_9SPIO|nr:2-oxoacid:acceptor oxidoreductase family protein [Spirochaetales bacterium]
MNNTELKNLSLNIYMSGVGGQGIGVLSEVLIRAYDDAGYEVKGVDTHGLAQRGGKVESHLRIGGPAGSPLIEPGTADIAVCLERTEAYRALVTYLKPGGVLIYYNTSWQSLNVRIGDEKEVTEALIKTEAENRTSSVYEILTENLPDVRLQNIGLLAGALREDLLPGLASANIENALQVLFSGDVLSSNLEILSG